LDSVTQAALGAAVGVAVMGRSRPLWQAALSGALVGTLPDLDVFIDQGDPIRNMVLHRAETHSLFLQTLASPLIALPLAALTRSPDLYRRWWLMVLLTLLTHSLLDAMTVYGTRIWLPFSDYPVGLGSIFIIDPLYTLPLLLGLSLTALSRLDSRRRWNAAGLALSTLYAAGSVAAQAHVEHKVQDAVIAAELPVERVLVTPTPFNTVLWRILLVGDDAYYEAFYSLLDPYTGPGRTIRFTRHERGRELDAKTTGFAKADLIRDFSKGFYALRDTGRQIHITDLRMGQHPYFVFSFAFAEHHSEPIAPIEPIHVRNRIPLRPGLAWLWRRLIGEDLPSPEGGSPAQ